MHSPLDEYPRPEFVVFGRLRDVGVAVLLFVAGEFPEAPFPRCFVDVPDEVEIVKDLDFLVRQV